MVDELFSLAISNFNKLVDICPCLLEDDFIISSHGISVSPGSMDLYLDINDFDGNIIDISFAHYFENNGYMVPNPDMTLRIFRNSAVVFPLSFVNESIYCDIKSDSSIPFNISIAQDLSLWLDNLKSQHHSIKTLSAN